MKIHSIKPKRGHIRPQAQALKAFASVRLVRLGDQSYLDGEGQRAAQVGPEGS